MNATKELGAEQLEQAENRATTYDSWIRPQFASKVGRLTHPTERKTRLNLLRPSWSVEQESGYLTEFPRARTRRPFSIMQPGVLSQAQWEQHFSAVRQHTPHPKHVCQAEWEHNTDSKHEAGTKIIHNHNICNVSCAPRARRTAQLSRK